MRTSFLQKEDKTTCAANTAEFDKFFHILTNSDIHCWSLLRLQAKKAQASNCHKVEPQIADIPKPFLRDNLLWRHSSVSLHFHTFPTVKLVKLFWENPGTRKEQMILPFHGLHDLEFILFAVHQPESAGLWDSPCSHSALLCRLFELRSEAQEPCGHAVFTWLTIQMGSVIHYCVLTLVLKTHRSCRRFSFLHPPLFETDVAGDFRQCIEDHWGFRSKGRPHSLERRTDHNSW